MVEEGRGAVEIIGPTDSVDMRMRMEAITALARAMQTLAAALDRPVQQVTINGNITATAEYGVKAKTKRG